MLRNTAFWVTLSTRRGNVVPACDHRPSQRGLGPAPFVAGPVCTYALDEDRSVGTHLTRSLDGFSLGWKDFDGLFGSPSRHRVAPLGTPLNQYESEGSTPRLAEAKLPPKFVQGGTGVVIFTGRAMLSPVYNDLPGLQAIHKWGAGGGVRGSMAALRSG